MKTLNQKIGDLGPTRRKRVEARAAALNAEEMTLQELRQARKLTQVRLAKTLGITQDGVVVEDNKTFHDYLKVIAWGMNFLKTQYDTYLHLNDPWFMPLTDLYNLAAQLGININSDISPYTLRKAVYFNATVNEQRGTPSGIATEVSALTGWNLDLTVGQNMMLENDQSEFLDPFFITWFNNTEYLVGDKVVFGNFWYICILAGNRGNAPTGTSSSNT